ncbi:sensor histidine kinase [Dyadobacter subterraneus]|uniref:Histidine kinase n=1 Tax=Dyadobacter subterraneus TaxID=2773304 RepID=A0ABR9WA14_9BACT|nr:histidine kinase [Dyadobacter subterraneus]MBE9461979.1 histidine kinase [Dyadobacter subterraneus]
MENKPFISHYWKCQLIGWTSASLYWTVQGYTGSGFRWDLAWVHLLSDVLMYIAITHLYRNFALKNRWQQLPLDHLLWRMLLAIPVMGVFYTVVTLVKLYLIRGLFLQNYQQRFGDFFELNGLGIFIGGIRLMAIWLLAYHLYHYAKREIRLSGENARLELGFKQAQLDNLSAQLNPHFLFNSLNTIKSLIYTNPDAAGRGIDLLSELLRSGLYSGPSMLISLEQEMELVRDYLELEQLRIQKRLTYDLNIDKSLLSQMVLRLSMQALVENAVKHGIAPRKEGGNIDISASKKEGYLHLNVTNPGILEYNNSHEGIGLFNLRERLEMTYQGLASLNLVQQGKKVCAQIKIPLL